MTKDGVRDFIAAEYALSENYVHGLAAFGPRLKNFECPHSSRGSSPGLPAGNSVIAGFPAWLAAKKTSWLRLTVLTNVFNFVLLALVPLWYIAFGSDGMEKTLAWYFSAAWALSGVLPAIFACAAFGTTVGRGVFTGGRN